MIRAAALAVPLALVLTSVLSGLAGAPARADDEPGPPLVGTRVAGSTDGSQAPALHTGRYLDRLPNADDLHYRIPRSRPGSTFHVSALFVGAGDSIAEGVRLSVGTTPDDQGCGSSGVFRPTLGEPAPVLFTTVSTWTDVIDHECAQADELFLTVAPPNDVADAGRDVEILVYEEPPLSAYAFALLPDPEQPTWTALEPTPPAHRVSPGTTPTNAPVVGDGSYAVALQPGRTIALAVPLDWDQSLQVQVDAVVPAGAPATDRVTARVLGPLLGSSQVSFTDGVPADWTTGPLPDGGRLRTGAQSHVVAYPNRDSYDATVNTESLAGIHYALVSWPGTDGATPGQRALTVPATVTLATSGVPGEGVPGYVDGDGPLAPQAASRLVDGSLRAPVAVEPDRPVPDAPGPVIDRRVLLGLGLCVVLGAGAVLRTAARRRRT